MTAAFALSCTGVFALAAAATSIAVGVAAFASKRRLLEMNPVDASRIVFAASIAPAVVPAILVTAWLADPHLFGCHQHRCLHDHAAVWPAVHAQLFIMAWCAHGTWRLLRLARGCARMRTLRRALAANAEITSSGALLVPIDEPQAFVIGATRPTVCVSQGLMKSCNAGEVEAVMAHECAHAQRRDPLRRLVAGVGLAFHVPPVARMIEGDLALVYEMAADAQAAAVVGDRTRVAEVLVRLARLRASQPAVAMGLVASNLETRVRTLLASAHTSERVSAASICYASTALALTALLLAHRVHLVAEALLRLL